MKTSMTEIRELSDREIKNTTWWGRGISLALIIQIVAIIWYGAQLDAQVKQNTDDIASLASRIDNNATVSISREQLEDILGSRDQQLDNLESAIIRMEQKINRLQ